MVSRTFETNGTRCHGPRARDGSPMNNDAVQAICDAIMDCCADRFRLVARITPFQGALYVRISAQMYNE